MVSQNQLFNRLRVYVPLLVFWMVLISVFQNFGSCGYSQSVHFKGTTSASNSGDGEPFDNKLVNGDYYRWIPDYKCKGKPMLLGTIQVSNSDIKAQILNTETCQMNSQPVSTTSLQPLSVSHISKEVLGFENSIYIKQDRKFDPSTPPNVTGEAWCQSENLHVFVSHDLALKQIKAELYERITGGDGTTTSRNIDLGVLSRSLTANLLEYNNQQVKVQINRVAKNNKDTWIGSVSYSDPSLGRITGQVECRLGSRLDPDNHFYPELNLDLFGPSLPSELSFSRNSTASFIDSNGMVRFALPNQPRFSHDPTTGAPLGLLIENTATNLLTNSQSLQSWNIFGLSTEIDTPKSLAPDGTQTAEYFSVTNNVEQHQVLRTFNGLPTNYYTFTVFAKVPTINPQRFLRLQIIDQSFTHQIWASFDLINQTVDYSLASGSASSLSSDITKLNGGWLRLRISGIPNTASANTQVFFEALDFSQSIGVYADPNQSGFFLWGAQFEVGAMATSYINTDSGNSTRQMDQVYADSSNWTNLNPNGGTWMVETRTDLAELIQSPTIKTTIALSNSSPNQIRLEYDPILSVLLGIFANLPIPRLVFPYTFIPQTSASIRSLIASDSKTIAIAAGGSDHSVPLSGGLFTPTQISIGGTSSNSKWPGHYQSFRYWPFLLEAETRILLTK